MFFCNFFGECEKFCLEIGKVSQKISMYYIMLHLLHAHALTCISYFKSFLSVSIKLADSENPYLINHRFFCKNNFLTNTTHNVCFKESYKRNYVLKKTKISLKLLDGALLQLESILMI